LGEKRLWWNVSDVRVKCESDHRGYDAIEELTSIGFGL
jgi:hypothetical protein